MLSISGIDEAGRGSVFGSLIIVGITLDSSMIKELLKNGLKDSKLFIGPNEVMKREKIALKIQKMALETKIVEISAAEVDKSLNNRPYDNLNLLEVRCIAKIILQIASPKIKIDTISTPNYLKKQLDKYLSQSKRLVTSNKKSCNDKLCKFTLKISENVEKKIIIAKKADKIFPIVSAASCVAKYIRDGRLRQIETEWDLPQNTLGYGYPNINDPNVMQFLDAYREEIKNHTFPFIRYSWDWKPLQKILQPKLKPLTEYFDK